MMIYKMSRDVDGTIRGRGFPIHVIYGPERLKRSPGHTVVRFERDLESGDAVLPAKGPQSNPKMKRIRALGVMVTVFAESTAEGARFQEHEGVCDLIVDALVAAIDEWFVLGKTGQLAEYTEARFLRPEELEGEYAQWPGVVYRLRFDLPRGVYVRTHKGEAQPTAEAPGFSGEVRVHREGSAEPPEIVPLPDPDP